ncbi:glycosyltransferase family 2 protein [Massilia horti]|uniref:Glycosyltransferase n=1 Tax=Massilia horti TaxID=2562153 RepID=A0A4Y9T1Y2_9BURK|nr:glycosyltransferase family 2 protein [Massilia horti]TFW33454.1 glycosyltransferase [Massilia horti]
MTPNPRLSVVISTYNWPEALQAVIEGFFRQTDLNFEIIVADDGSGQATRECVERLRERSPVPIMHVWQPDLGYRLSMSRNRGIRASSGDYVLVLDGDCIPRRNYIEQHRKLARAGFMVTGSRILLNAAASQRVLAGRLDLQSIGLTDKLRLRLRGEANKLPQLLWTLPDIGREKSRFSWRRIKGCNMGIWRADLERINGFDESFQGWGHEDADLVVRLFHAGVMRKDGAFATEVFHLWHREAKRDHASSNRRMVLERRVNKTTQAVKGLREQQEEAVVVQETDDYWSSP